MRLPLFFAHFRTFCRHRAHGGCRADKYRPVKRARMVCLLFARPGKAASRAPMFEGLLAPQAPSAGRLPCTGSPGCAVLTCLDRSPQVFGGLHAFLRFGRLPTGEFYPVRLPPLDSWRLFSTKPLSPPTLCARFVRAVLRNLLRRHCAPFCGRAGLRFVAPRPAAARPGTLARSSAPLDPRPR